MSSNNQTWAQRAAKVMVPNYQPAELCLVRGEGSYLYDVEGSAYLDLVSGIAVNALGYGNAKLKAALHTQIDHLLHVSNLYLNEQAICLAEQLVAHSFGDRVFFCNSGAEANEAAIKLARRYAFQNAQPERVEIVSFEKAFHGRTYGALAATGQPKYMEGFGPMPGGFVQRPLGDVQGLRAACGPKTAAIIVEPIQGEGGVRTLPDGFLAECRNICDKVGALLIVDEVQVGLGRTGRLFAYEHSGVRPDIMSLAKGLGGGLPLGAILATESVASALQPGHHGTTFGGNPVACSAGRVVLDTVLEPGFMARVQTVGERLVAGLHELRTRLGVFEEIRGVGLILGAVVRPGLGFDAKDIVKMCRQVGLLLHIAGPDVVRILPPLTLSEKEVAEALTKLEQVLVQLQAEHHPNKA